MENPKDNETLDASVVTGKPTGPKGISDADNDMTITEPALQEIETKNELVESIA